MANLVEEILRQQESQQGAQRTHTNTQASTTDPTTSTDPADTATQPAATAAASRAKKAVIVPGLEGTHFNSVVSRPARSMKGKRGGTQAVLGQAPPGAVNAVVWLRQVRGPSCALPCIHSGRANTERRTGMAETGGWAVTCSAVPLYFCETRCCRICTPMHIHACIADAQSRRCTVTHVSRHHEQ